MFYSSVSVCVRCGNVSCAIRCRLLSGRFMSTAALSTIHIMKICTFSSSLNIIPHCAFIDNIRQHKSFELVFQSAVSNVYRRVNFRRRNAEQVLVIKFQQSLSGPNIHTPHSNVPVLDMISWPTVPVISISLAFSQPHEWTALLIDDNSAHKRLYIPCTVWCSNITANATLEHVPSIAAESN